MSLAEILGHLDTPRDAACWADPWWLGSEVSPSRRELSTNGCSLRGIGRLGLRARHRDELLGDIRAEV